MPIKISISIDYRERTLSETIQPMISNSGKPEICLEPPINLLVGDIILSVIGDLGQTLRQLIIERKSYTDLIASIKDGRYKEQKLRLQSVCAQNIWPTRFIYLVESGTTPDDQSGPLFYGSWVSMVLRDNIPVVRVLSITEGARFITRLADRLIRDYNDLIPEYQKPEKLHPSTAEKPSETDNNIRQIILTPRTHLQQLPEQLVVNNNNSQESSDKSANLNGDSTSGPEFSEYTRAIINGIKTKKGDNMTRELCHKTMLSIIPGISAGLCEQILAGYGGSIARLIRFLELPEGGTETKESKVATMAATEIRTSTGKTRKLGPVLAQRLWDYLGTQ